MMIAEWLYEAACIIGGGFNNSLGIERSPQEDVVSGITALWIMLVFMTIIAILLAILLWLEVRDNKIPKEELEQLWTVKK